MPRAFLDNFYLRIRQIGQNVAGFVADLLGSQVTGHMIIHFAGAGFEILVELSFRRQFRKKFHGIHRLRANGLGVVRAEQARIFHTDHL